MRLRYILAAALLGALPSLAQAQITTPNQANYLPGAQNNTGTALTGPMEFPCDVDTSNAGAPGSTSTTGYCNVTQISTYESSSTETLTNKTISGSSNTITNIAPGSLSLTGRFTNNAGSLDIASASITSAMIATSGVTAGSYTCSNITVNGEGIVTSAASGSCPGGNPGNVSTSATLTLDALVLGNGTTTVGIMGSLGTTGQLLHSAGASSAPTWANLNLGTDPISGNILLANINSATNASANTVLTGSGTTGAWGNVTGTMFGQQTINEFLGSPCTGSSATPSFRTLCIQDLPAVPVALNATAPASNTLGGIVDLTGTGTFTVSTSTIPQGDIIVVNNVGTGNWTISGAVTGLNGGASSTTFRPGMNGIFYGNSSGALSYQGIQPPTTTVLGVVLAVTCGANQSVTAINTDGSETCSSTAGSGTVTTTGSPVSDGFAYMTGSTSVSSTAAATNGQLLIGSTGNPPVAATLTGTSPVGITNAAGSITITCTTCATVGGNNAFTGTNTAVTQSAKNNSTDLATTAYVDAPTGLTTGTSVSLTGPRQYFVCTGTCTVTPPTPAAGYEFCVANDDNTTSTITFAAISGVQYETTARTSYKSANTSIVSGGAAGDKLCILGRDSTHYLVASFNGTWS